MANKKVNTNFRCFECVRKLGFNYSRRDNCIDLWKYPEYSQRIYGSLKRLNSLDFYGSSIPISGQRISMLSIDLIW